MADAGSDAEEVCPMRSLLRSFAMHRRVIGALMMRETYTRAAKTVGCLSIWQIFDVCCRSSQCGISSAANANKTCWWCRSCGAANRYRLANPGCFENCVRHGFPMGRLGTANEVADVIVFLASPRGHWINGLNIPVDGLEKPHPPLDRRPY
jgi:hypothetical protein